MSYCNIWDEFFNTFKFEKVEYEVPGRDWDDDGLASWYVEKGWPHISAEILINLICLTQQYYQERGLFLRAITSQDIEIECLEALLDAYKLSEDKSSIIKQVKDAFDEELY